MLRNRPMGAEIAGGLPNDVSRSGYVIIMTSTTTEDSFALWSWSTNGYSHVGDG